MNNNDPSLLVIVVPCYNEQEIFLSTAAVLDEIISKLITNRKVHPDNHILFVDDGSRDMTWEFIKKTGKENPRIKGIKLSHNRGHQIALLAGMSRSNGEMTVTIDADLQDDPQAIEKMVDQYLAGYDIVYGVRSSRKHDTLFKRNSARIFYKLMNYMGVKQVSNHADYRLLNLKAKQALLQYEEANLYLRGLVPLLGFKTTEIYYERGIRRAGESKYPLSKMISLAIEGITSFSVKPLKVITFIGLSIFLVSILAGMYILAQKFLNNTVPGWTSIILIGAFFGGIQLFSLGIIGEYIGKIYYEVKKRPKFFIEEEC